ncbi:protein fem-1 homolog C-like [Mizuhopecten yessoensis]|uniref:Protein fem-1-like C n=1 Tax=Mizuhopecten yessoensis TaxID=6573 RepID=A0A210R6M2_MIZYE|nr:protein fem-1 homolog C-like [Mizuhopecten yessoensis]XP_021346136.1 protein fem-1 homolog C-like [Mizuhopecten yessoensis]XP_021346144.1 protein fem-1 homolog C-like [Mizuhopecten yessoensis]OWF56605.1 Protein fem-1-like C [Mizuhopecten yessoensis]
MYDVSDMEEEINNVAVEQPKMHPRNSRMPEVVKEACIKVKSFIDLKNLEALKLYLSNYNKDDQSRIINHVQDDQAPFFRACMLGQADIVNYMLTECSAETELRGLYILKSEDFNDEVTPLWVSVSEQHFAIVKLLVEHGADIHASTATNSSPVRCACYCANLAIVKYLVENGANIHQPNVYGGTCLMNATKGSMELCEFLVNNGASVNATTVGGHTAMYHAIKSGRLDLVKFFLGVGASHFVTISTEIHILHLAAIQGNQTIFDYIKDNTVMKLSRLVDGYELLGATAIDDLDNIPEGLRLWNKAMDLRYANPDAPLTKIIPEETQQVYRFHRETTTPEQCKALVASDTDKINMHALLARARILGTRHERTINEIRYRGAMYADSDHYQRAVDLWKYAYHLSRQCNSASDEVLVFDLTLFVDLLKEMLSKGSSGQISEKVQTSDIVDVFALLVKQLQEFAEILKVRPLQKNTFKNFRSLLLIAIDFMNFFYLSEGHDEERERFTEEVNRVMILDAESENGERLLHLALMIDSAKSDAALPSIDVIRALIKAGASVNVTDNDKNAPLHHCITSWRKQIEIPDRGNKWKELAWVLIEQGTHMDTRNCNKDTPLAFLQEQGCVRPLQYTSLKCLAARVIVHSGIMYRGYLPTLLKSFVEIHE